MTTHSNFDVNIPIELKIDDYCQFVMKRVEIEKNKKESEVVDLSVRPIAYPSQHISRSSKANNKVRTYSK